MRKEVEFSHAVEIELKLLVPFPTDYMRHILGHHFGSGSERSRELTVMYDNVTVLEPKRNTYNLTRTNGLNVLLIPEQEVTLAISKLNEFIRIFEAIGYKLMIAGDNITFSLDRPLPVGIMTIVQDSRLRLRRINNALGEKAEISYKRPLQRSGIKKEIEFETEIGNFEIAEALLSILGFHQKTSYERFRTTWLTEIEGKKIKIELDEFPFGTYLEIEGPSTILINTAAQKIGLNAEDHIGNSYDGIYKELMLANGLTPEHHIRF